MTFAQSTASNPLEVALAPVALRVLLLAVAFGPLAFAAIVALLGRNASLVRRVAGLLAAIHLGATIFLVVPAAIYISNYSEVAFREGFLPTAVPGDPGSRHEIGLGGGEEHRTEWNIFFVGQPKPGYPPPAVQLFLGLDGINIWLVALASLMSYVAVIVSGKFAQQNPGGYYAWLFVLQSFTTAAFASFDVLLFYVFFELTLVPSFFLIGGWGVGAAKREAARKFFLYTLLGGVFTLVGVVGIVATNSATDQKIDWMKAGEPMTDLPRGPVTFDVNKLMIDVSLRRQCYDLWIAEANASIAAKAWEKNAGTARASWKQADYEKWRSDAVLAQQGYRQSQLWLFFALIAGFVVKIPLVPFHTWLPGAYSEAPPAVTLLMSALLAKLGTLGLLRFVLPLCPDAAVQYGLPVFGTLGAIGIVYAAFCAFGQKDFKLMAAYSSISHLGLLVLGLFALNAEGLTGAVLHMVNHGLTAGAMFALVAFLYDRFRTTEMPQFGGLIASFPRFAFFAFFTALASIGLPGLNNFVSEMLLLSGLFTPWNVASAGYALAIAGAAGLFLSAWYTFTMLKSLFFGPPKMPTAVSHGENAVVPKDLSGRELLAIGLPCLASLILGLYPQPFIDVIRCDLRIVEKRMHEARVRQNPELAAREIADLPVPKSRGSQTNPLPANQAGPLPGPQRNPPGGPQPPPR